MNRPRPALALLDHHLRFPAAELALCEPNGLLAVGGDLSTQRLLLAYRSGIFPWFGDGEPMLWWSPDPRAVLFPEHLILSSRLRRFIRNTPLRVTLNMAFPDVINACAETPRRGQSSTWITQGMRRAFHRLHLEGHAHSVEIWEGSALIGGIYGVCSGHLFCGESMFSLRSNASKVALFALCRLMQEMQMPLLDCQVANAHTLSLGAEEIRRADYLQKIAGLIHKSLPSGSWTARELPAADSA